MVRFRAKQSEFCAVLQGYDTSKGYILSSNNFNSVIFLLNDYKCVVKKVRFHKPAEVLTMHSSRLSTPDMGDYQLLRNSRLLFLKLERDC